MPKQRDNYVRGYNNGFTVGYFTKDIDGAVSDTVRSLKELNPGNLFIEGLAEGMKAGLEKSRAKERTKIRLKVVMLLTQRTKRMKKDKTNQR